MAGEAPGTRLMSLNSFLAVVVLEEEVLGVRLIIEPFFSSFIFEIFPELITNL